MFRRVRIDTNGFSVVKDIEDHGRAFPIFAGLLPPQTRFSNMVESWGGVDAVAGVAGPDPSDPVPMAGSRIVCAQLFSSFLSQGKSNPLTMLPITIEIELADQHDAFAGTAEKL